jgi:hypothetical protein
MYAGVHETGARFFAGVRQYKNEHWLSATPLHHAAVREWFCASTVTGNSRRSESLSTAPIFGV